MDFDFHPYRVFERFRIPNRIPKISRFAEFAKEHPLVWIPFWGILSLGLGILAQQNSQSEALLQWRKTHRPGIGVWRQYFQSRGFQEVRDYPHVFKLGKSLPSSGLQEEGQIWMSNPAKDNPPCFALIQEIAPLPVQIFCQAEKGEEKLAPPTSWRPIDLGWEALERLEEGPFSPSIRLLAQRDGARAPLRKIPRDPRQILY